MEILERVTRGLAAYIYSIDYSPEKKRISIKFVKSPQEPLIDRILIFSNIQQFSDERNWDEIEDNGYLDLLIGLDEYPERSGVKYVVHTDQREIIFVTDRQPVLREVSTERG
jgi:hypothetical protein